MHGISPRRQKNRVITCTSIGGGSVYFCPILILTSHFRKDSADRKIGSALFFILMTLRHAPAFCFIYPPLMRRICCFNPLAPCGVRQQKTQHFTYPHSISIHSPPCGMRLAVKAASSFYMSFNPLVTRVVRQQCSTRFQPAPFFIPPKHRCHQKLLP